MDFNPLLDLIAKSKKICIRTHENADADAVGSSLALKTFIEQLGKKPVVTARSVSKLGKFLVDDVGEVILTEDSSTRFDLTIYVDARPPGEEDRVGRVAVIDHHEGKMGFRTSYALVDPSFSSASEMVYEFGRFLLSSGRIPRIEERAGKLLIWGIIADTGGLRLAVKDTLERLIGITDATGVEVRDAYSTMRTPPDPSLKMACLKGASRLKIRKQGKILIVTTDVSSFQGDVAGSLVSLGADIAFAGGRKTKLVNVSARSRNHVVDMGLSLAKVMGTVAGRIGGRGGGHAGAAALKGPGDVQNIIDMCVSETRRELRELERTGANKA
jgi:nanoRNase/pAp phosphatase (c-di-AMP/oligoRNAs hydrolase)